MAAPNPSGLDARKLAFRGFGPFDLAVRVTARRLFDDRDRLRMDRFQNATPPPKAGRRASRSSGHVTGKALVVLGLLMAFVGAVMHFMPEELHTAVVTVAPDRTPAAAARIPKPQRGDISVATVPKTNQSPIGAASSAP